MMRKFILCLTEVDCDDDFKPKRFRALKNTLVVDEQELELLGKQAIYHNLFNQLQKSLDDMRVMYMKDKINTDENSLIQWQEYKEKENEKK